MFDSNYAKLYKRITCDDDCKQSGCPGHILELTVHSTAGRGTLSKDGVQLLSMDRNMANALYDMFNDLKNE